MKADNDYAETHAEELRRAEQDRWLAKARAGSSSTFSRLRDAIRARLAPDHSLTDYPCRLPDGRMGRVAVIQQDGDWTMVCRMA